MTEPYAYEVRYEDADELVYAAWLEKYASDAVRSAPRIPLYKEPAASIGKLERFANRWEIRPEDADDFPSPAAKYPDLRMFHLGVCGDGEHAYNWSDKPHRLVYDLTRMVAELRDEIRALAKD